MELGTPGDTKPEISDGQRNGGQTKYISTGKGFYVSVTDRRDFMPVKTERRLVK